MAHGTWGLRLEALVNAHIPVRLAAGVGRAGLSY